MESSRFVYQNEAKLNASSIKQCLNQLSFLILCSIPKDPCWLIFILDIKYFIYTPRVDKRNLKIMIFIFIFFRTGFSNTRQLVTQSYSPAPQTHAIGWAVVLSGWLSNKQSNVLIVFERKKWPYRLPIYRFKWCIHWKIWEGQLCECVFVSRWCQNVLECDVLTSSEWTQECYWHNAFSNWACLMNTYSCI